MFRTLSRTFVCCLAVVGLLAGCGGDDDQQQGDRTERFHRTTLNRPSESGTLEASACRMMRPREIARIVRRPGIRFEPTPNNSTDLSICDWRGKGVRVQLFIDGAPRAQLRYYNQLAEQLQFHNADPEQRPYKQRNVGEDSTYGGAGAWWTRPKSQLVAYAKQRILRIRVVGPDFDDDAKRRAAVRLARLSFRRLNGPRR